MKKKLYIILPILSMIFLLSTAAICDLGKILNEGVLGDIADNINQSIASNNDQNKDSTSKNNSSDNAGSGSASSDSSGSNSSSSDNTGSQNKKSSDAKNSSDSQNSPPVINSISHNSDEFFPNLQYTFTCDVSDPDNDTISYDWHVDAGNLDTGESDTVKWTAPGSEGLYDITLTVSDGWGGYDSMTKTVAVGKIPLDAAPVIHDIAVYPDGEKYTENTYQIWCEATDPNASMLKFDFKVTGGNLHDQDANTIKWDTPNASGTYIVTVTVTDKEGNIVTSSKNIAVEQYRIEITDIIVQIDYISAGSAYYIKGVLIDPKSELQSFTWATSGGYITDQVGNLAAWQTPYEPGVYSLTLTASTLGGYTVTRTKNFTVNPRK